MSIVVYRVVRALLAAACLSCANGLPMPVAKMEKGIAPAGEGGLPTARGLTFAPDAEERVGAKDPGNIKDAAFEVLKKSAPLKWINKSILWFADKIPCSIGTNCARLVDWSGDYLCADGTTVRATLTIPVHADNAAGDEKAIGRWGPGYEEEAIAAKGTTNEAVYWGGGGEETNFKRCACGTAPMTQLIYFSGSSLGWCNADDELVQKPCPGDTCPGDTAKEPRQGYTVEVLP